MTGTSLRAHRKTIAIVLVAAIVASAGFLIYPFITHAGSKNPGMPLTVTVYSVGQPAAAYVSLSNLSTTSTGSPLSGVSINIFSSMPASLTARTIALNLTKMNESQNNYQVLLYSGMTGRNGVANAFLNRTTLSTIDGQWQSIASPRHTLAASFSIYADYGVVHNGSLYSYYYYNNIPYDPFNQTYSNFNVSITMNLSSPWSVVPLNGTASSSVLTASPYRLPNPPPCSTGYTYALLNETTEIGNFPIILVYLNDSGAADPFSAIQGFLPGNFSAGFNSDTLPPTTSINQATQVQMSSQPSITYSNDQLNYTFPAGATSANGNLMIAEAYLPNVTMHVTNYQVFYTYVGAGGQCDTQNLGVQTTIKVAAINQLQNEQNPFRSIAYNNTSIGWFIQKAYSMSPAGQQNIAAGYTSINATEALYNTSAWSNAASAEQSVVSGLSVFTATLGLALSIMTAASAFEGVGTAADVAEAISLMDAVAGYSLAVISAFSSISFSTTYIYSTITSFTNSLSGAGNTYNVAMYDSSYTSVISLGGTSYHVNMPQIYYYVTA